MSNLTIEDYVKPLVKELNDHFYYEPYRSRGRGWWGFIYCSCSDDSFYSKEHRTPHETHIYGAVARLDDTKLWFIDGRINHYPNGDNKEPYRNPSVNPLSISDPQFHEKFFEIVPWHKMLVEYFNNKHTLLAKPNV